MSAQISQKAKELVMGIRVVPGVSPRVESGAVAFGDDWAGVFIRGDEAFGLLMYLESEGAFRDQAIETLKDYLRESDERTNQREPA